MEYFEEAEKWLSIDALLPVIAKLISGADLREIPPLIRKELINYLYIE